MKVKGTCLLLTWRKKWYRNSILYNTYTAGYSVFHVLVGWRNATEEDWIAVERKNGGRHGGVAADTFDNWKIWIEYVVLELCNGDDFRQ